jgi:lipoprotein-anchoring transpeptidase ErfK/SrfK
VRPLLANPAFSVRLAFAAFIAAALAFASLVALVSPAQGSARRASVGLSFPLAGSLLQSKVVARTTPSSSGRVVKNFTQFRPDYRPTILFAFAGKKIGRSWWMHIEIPGRPNGRTGWVKASGVVWSPRSKKIVVDLSAMTVTLFQGSKVLLSTRAAVGRPGMETPTGHFYILAGYHPTEAVLGNYAFETSAYSKLSDWPGGGIVGIHAWTDPSVFGHAVSHGCVRVPNDVAAKLRDLVPPGTPVTIQP